MRTKHTLFGLALLGVLPLGSAAAQAVMTLETARRQIEDLSIDAALAGLRSVLDQRQQLSQQQLVRAYVLLGIAEASRGQGDAAQAAFHEALWLDPVLRVDSLTYLSSRLTTVFARERARWSSVLRVTSEPRSAQILVGSHSLGATPIARGILGDTLLSVEARRDDGRKAINLLVPSRSVVTVHFRIPQDTAPWPTLSLESAREKFLAASATEWAPSRPAPTMVPSELKNSHVYAVAGGLIGLVTGIVLATKVNYNDPDVCQPGKANTCKWAVGGLLTGAVTVVGVVVGLPFDAVRQKGARRRYEDYVARRDSWQHEQEAERGAWIDERVKRALAETQLERQAVVEHNATIRARNAELGEPQITVERLPRR